MTARVLLHVFKGQAIREARVRMQRVAVVLDGEQCLQSFLVNLCVTRAKDLITRVDSSIEVQKTEANIIRRLKTNICLLNNFEDIQIM